MPNRLHLAVVVAGGICCGLAWACLAPTSIKIRVSTNVDCAVVARQGVSLYGGTGSGDPITTTQACVGNAAPRAIGTFVFTPSGDNDDAVSIAVVAGVTRPSEDCARNNYAGCIVSRRRLRFAPHEPLELPIDLSLACLDIPCSDDRTCSVGRCVKADIEDPEFSCMGPQCGLPPDAPQRDASLDDIILLGKGHQGAPIVDYEDVLFRAKSTGGADLYLAHATGISMIPDVE